MDWTPFIDWLSSHGARILVVIVLFAILFYILRRAVPHTLRSIVARRMVERPEEEIEKRTTTLSRVFVNTGVVLIILAAVLMILSEVGISIAPLIAGFGIAGLAIGFGAQYLIRDIIAGLFILMENHYSVGDWVSIADIGGMVEEINLRRTILRDLDGTLHVVPNGEIRVASNFTQEWARVNMKVSVGYGEDLDHVTEVLNRIGKEMAEDPYWRELILKAPQVLRVDAFEDSGIALKVLGETKAMRQWEVMGELRRRIKKVFDEEGIEIPWPHTKVYFGNVPPPSGLAAEAPPPSAPREAPPTPEEEGE